MQKNPVLVIVGGGASGLISGIFAKNIVKDKARVVILERMDRIGKKILATGNGRCNFTNISTSECNFYGKNPKFVSSAFEKFNVFDTLNFFEKLGIYPKEEENGKMYPYSNQASSILDVLRSEIERLKIEVITKFEVKEVKPQKNNFKIISFSGDVINADKVIIATGGCASPNLGSNGTGFKILESLGHNITKLTPALVQMKTDKKIVSSLKGIKFVGNVKIFVKNKFFKEEFGEVLFTDYGLSGPPIFQLSSVSALHKDCFVELDFIPDLSEKDVFDLIVNRKKDLSHLTMENFFTGLLNKRIGNVIAKKSGIEKLSFKVSDLTKEIMWEIARNIKSLKIEVLGQNGWNNAQVTAGGAITDEFNKETMESRKIKGLYATGEVLDIFGDCGGFNLQWAWSSGVVAGESSAKSILGNRG